MKKIGVQNFPLKWLPKEKCKHYNIVLLTETDEDSGDTKCEVLEDLVNKAQSSPENFKKLMTTLHMQVERSELIKNETRLKKYDKDKTILEFKGSSSLQCL